MDGYRFIKQLYIVKLQTVVHTIIIKKDKKHFENIFLFELTTCVTY